MIILTNEQIVNAFHVSLFERFYRENCKKYCRDVKPKDGVPGVVAYLIESETMIYQFNLMSFYEECYKHIKSVVNVSKIRHRKSPMILEIKSALSSFVENSNQEFKLDTIPGFTSIPRYPVLLAFDYAIRIRTLQREDRTNDFFDMKTLTKYETTIELLGLLELYTKAVKYIEKHYSTHKCDFYFRLKTYLKAYI